MTNPGDHDGPQTPMVGQSAPDASVQDDQGNTVSLSSNWRDNPIILIFVRHLGCPLCRSRVSELRDRYEEIRAARGSVVLVTMGSPAEVTEFKQQFQLPFLCLSDPEQRVYRAYGVPRGRLRDVAGPSMWGAGFRAVCRAGIGVPKGDPYQLQSTFVIDSRGTIQLCHRPKNSGDDPSIDELLAALAAIR